jgi:RHS repeat-associated protein
LAEITPTNMNGTLSFLRRYLAKTPDALVGLTQFGTRYYEPLTGRFISPDHYVLECPDVALGDPQTFNLYSYAAGNPYRFHDPSGRFPILAVVIGALIGAYLGNRAAEENGENPWTGALIGAIVGGLVGYYGLLGGALKGAAIGAASSAASGDGRIWTGAALGFAFGAAGEALTSTLPTVGGEGFWVKSANAMIEIGGDALIAGMQSGTSAVLAHKSFENGFWSGAAMGAAFSALKIAVFGVRYDPKSIQPDYNRQVGLDYAKQNADDTGNFLSGRIIQPDPSSVVYRSGGLIHWANGGVSTSFGNTVHTSADTMTELRDGSYVTLAHELRHIAQEREIMGGTVSFIAVWLVQYVTQQNLFYTSPPQQGGSNTTLEPYYGR